MRAWWHWVLVILGTIVAVALLAAGGLAYLVLRLDVRGAVERAVENATGRDLTINGDVGVSYWPVLGLHAANDTLANVPGGRASAFIAADDIHVGVELAPLLNRQVVVRQLVLQHPRIALEVDAAGHPNWTLTPRVRAVAASSGAPPSPPIIDASRTTLRQVSITDGEVTYFDARHGSGWSIGDVDLETALTALNQPMRVQGSIRYNDRPVQIDMNIASPDAIIHARAAPVEVNLRSDLVIAAFEGQTPAASGEMSGTVHAYGPSLRQLASWVGAPFQGGVGFEHFDVTGHVQIGAGQYAFNDAAFVIDQLSGRGDFALMSLRGKPYLSGRLELFDFDLNPYISGRAPPQTPPPPAPAPASPATTASAPTQTPQRQTSQIVVIQPPDRVVDIATPPAVTPIDYSVLHAFNADLELVTHAMLVSHTRVDSSRLTLVLNDGYLAATAQTMALYGGSGHGRFEIDARDPDAHFAEDLTFDNLNAQAFLVDTVNFSSIEGRAELTSTLRTHGRTQRELVANAIGRSHIEVVSGVLHGVDLGGVAATISHALRGELIAPEARTPFQGFSANLSTANGAIASDDLSFNTRDLRIPGIGIVDFLDRRLDLRIAPRSPRGGIVIPFTINGPFNQLRYNSDIGGSALHQLQPRVRAVQQAAR